MVIYLAETCRLFLAQFMFPNCSKSSLEWNSSKVMYQLKNNTLRYITIMLYSEKLSRNISSVMTEFYYLAFGSLLQWSSFVATFLSFTWRRNMKKDSVSCIICDRTIHTIISDLKMCVFNQEFRKKFIEMCEILCFQRDQKFMVIPESFAATTLWFFQD
jgi:hypothetical protein